MPQAHRLHALLGFSSKIPSAFSIQEILRDIGEPGEPSRVIRFQVLSADAADTVSKLLGNKNPGRGRPRIFAECDSCGVWYSCGRFNQHYRSHKSEGTPA